MGNRRMLKALVQPGLVSAIHPLLYLIPTRGYFLTEGGSDHASSSDLLTLRACVALAAAANAADMYKPSAGGYKDVPYVGVNWSGCTSAPMAAPARCSERRKRTPRAGYNKAASSAVRSATTSSAATIVFGSRRTYSAIRYESVSKPEPPLASANSLTALVACAAALATRLTAPWFTARAVSLMAACRRGCPEVPVAFGLRKDCSGWAVGAP